MKHILCFLFGHKPRGPLEGLIHHSDRLELEELIYYCNSCDRAICFDRQFGWVEIGSDWDEIERNNKIKQ